MQVYTENLEAVQASGKNVRELISEMEKNYPGIKDALVKQDRLKPGIAIMLDGKISQLGLLQPLSEENEVVFIPAVSGG